MIEPATASAPPGEPEGIGDLLGRLVEDGKAYARAEVAYVRTLGAEKAGAYKATAILGVVAILFAHAAFLALCALVWVALAQLMNPALAGLLTVVILGALAALLGKLALARLPGHDEVKP